MQWFRLYDDIINDPKILRMSEAYRWYYIAVLCATAENDKNGLLPCDCDIAFMIRVPETEWQKIKQELIDRGFIYNKGNGDYYVRDWHKFRPCCNRPSSLMWAKIRLDVFERDDFTCQYCGVRGVRLECDHVVPVSRGGNSDYSNLATACYKCNRSKHNKLIEEWGR